MSDSIANIIDVIIEYILSNWVGLLITSVITFVGASLYKSKKYKRIAYTIKSVRIFQKVNIAKLTILFENQKIPRLTQSYFLFWNMEKQTINEENVPKGNHELKIMLNDKSLYEIYQAEIVCYNNDANNIRIDYNKKSIIIKYEYLDHNEGAIIEILHSAKSNNDFTVTGKIKDSKPFKRIKYSSYEISVISALMPLMTVIACIIACINSYKSIDSVYDPIITIVASIIFTVLVIVICVPKIILFFKIPKSHRNFMLLKKSKKIVNIFFRDDDDSDASPT
jgi:hypothetical protein